jgi:hypothetical protein
MTKTFNDANYLPKMNRGTMNHAGRLKSWLKPWRQQIGMQRTCRCRMTVRCNHKMSCGRLSNKPLDRQAQPATEGRANFFG